MLWFCAYEIGSHPLSDDLSPVLRASGGFHPVPFGGSQFTGASWGEGFGRRRGSRVVPVVEVFVEGERDGVEVSCGEDDPPVGCAVGDLAAVWEGSVGVDGMPGGVVWAAVVEGGLLLRVVGG